MPVTGSKVLPGYSMVKPGGEEHISYEEVMVGA